MRRLPIHALALALALGPCAFAATAQRASQRPASAAPARQRAAARPPNPALHELNEAQNRRRNEALAFERVKGSAHTELERRRVNAGLGGSEPQVVRFLLSEELLHRERAARLARLREIAVGARNANGVAAVDQLARIERAQYVELLRTGTRRLSAVTQRELQAVLVAGRVPTPDAPIASVPPKGAKGKGKGKGKGAGTRAVAGAPREPRTAR